MKRIILILPFLALPFVSCDTNDDYTVPDITKELCMFTWHGVSRRATFLTDSGRNYSVASKVNFTTLKIDSAYRMTVAYVPNADSVSAVLYSYAYVPMLGDSTRNTIKSDTLTNISSIWLGGGYVNMALRFMRDGSQFVRQAFGYRVDSVANRGENGHEAAHCHLSLLYLKNGVRGYYTESICFSLDPEKLGLVKGDTVSFHTVTKEEGRYDYQLVL